VLGNSARRNVNAGRSTGVSSDFIVLGKLVYLAANLAVEIAGDSGVSSIALGVSGYIIRRAQDTMRSVVGRRTPRPLVHSVDFETSNIPVVICSTRERIVFCP
jgi:hypothetical protein